jgi:hypothetical protein
MIVYCGKSNLWTDKRVVFPLVELELPIKWNWSSNLHRAIQNKMNFQHTQNLASREKFRQTSYKSGLIKICPPELHSSGTPRATHAPTRHKCVVKGEVLSAEGRADWTCSSLYYATLMQQQRARRTMDTFLIVNYHHHTRNCNMKRRTSGWLPLYKNLCS